jgi:hypothetical protein
MSGKTITIKQKRTYMDLRNSGDSQELAAAKVNISTRSAKRVDSADPNYCFHKKKRGVKKDPFEDVWVTHLVPLLEKEPTLQAITLLEDLQTRFPDQYDQSLLRTLQRRLKNWKAINGPAKEVIFRQNHPPGWQGLSDFTNCNELNITIRDVPFPHLIYHFYLAFSHWEYAHVITGGESFSALSEGLQNALVELQGCPFTHRTDSLSAAYKNLKDSAEFDFTESYEKLCSDYNIKPTRNNKGVGHENGSVEVSHRHFKSRVNQALMMRGSRDFSSLEEYRKFIHSIANKQNSKRQKAIQEEKKHLHKLPEHRSRDFDVETVRVGSTSIILVRQVRYSVPPKLIGNLLKIHLYDDRLECFLGSSCVFTTKRLRWNKGPRPRSINYRFIIPALARKPQAFRNYVYRNDLFPTYAFQKTWELLDEQLDDRTACKEIVRILKFTADSDKEEEVSKFLEELLLKKQIPRMQDIERHFEVVKESKAKVQVITREPSAYDALLETTKDWALV